MRALLPLVLFALAPLALVPSTGAGVCDHTAGTVCVGYTVLSTDCRVGAIAVNGVFANTAVLGFIIGEVYWSFCQGGILFSGHSIEAFSMGWYDLNVNGQRSCMIYAYVAEVPMDCAYGPPVLPTLP